MQRIIVADTSCLILLQKINKLDLLKDLFGKILITQEVKEELKLPLPEFIEIRNPQNSNYQFILESIVYKGEASAIALAFENKDSLLIIDERKGRREAKSLKLNITGTIGILLLAKQKQLIPSLSSIFKKIEKTDFRISTDVMQEALRISGEKIKN